MLAIERAVEALGERGPRRLRSTPVALEQLYAVHSRAHVERIERLCRDGGGSIDLDTVVSPGSWEAARHAAGGAVGLVDLLLGGEAPAGFSAHRPPGHHAESGRAMGFCLFNNVAIAAAHALDAHGCQRVAIFDWDVHHGNGTSEIFHASSNVLYVSIHQSPLYPGTGGAGDRGAQGGEGFTVNLPVAPGSGDELYRALVDRVVCPLLREFAPQLVLVSAGYDAHRDDPLADCLVSEAGYAHMTHRLSGVCSELGAPLGLVLEGGYELGALASSVAVTLGALDDGHRRLSGEASDHPHARSAARTLADRWPSLLSGA